MIPVTPSLDPEHIYTIIFEKSPYALSLTKMPEGTLVSVNDAFLKFFGFTHDEVIGKTSSELEIADADSRARVADELQRHGSVHDFEVSRRTKSGDQLILAISLDWVDVGGEKYVLTTIRDLSAHRKAEQALAASNLEIDNKRKQSELALREMADKYSSLFNTTSDGVWIHNLDGVILEVNDAYCQMSGYSRTELINMPVSTLEAAESPADITAHIQKLLDQGGHDRFESKHRRKDGSLFDVDITALYFDHVNGRIAIFVRDITARKQAEQRLAYLATFPENNPRPIAEVDLEGRIHYANPVARLQFPDLLERGRSHPWLADWDTVVQHYKHGKADIIVRDIAVGDRFYQQSLNYLGPQHLVRIYGLDITERKLAEQALKLAHDELERRVHQRTQELDIANTQLRSEVMERQKAQVELESSLQELQVIEEELRNNN